MRRTMLLVAILLFGAVLLLVARPQQEQPLGDVARQLREQREKEGKKATKVFTNDNLPAPAPGEVAKPQAAEPAPKENPSTPAESASKPAAAAPPTTTNQPAQPEAPQDESKTRDYWQAKFKAARENLAAAKKMQQLAEDELDLLQIQQVREMDPGAKADLDAKVQDKQSEVDINKPATEAAQKALENLEKEFQESGAPDDWSQTE